MVFCLCAKFLDCFTFSIILMLLSRRKFFTKVWKYFQSSYQVSLKKGLGKLSFNEGTTELWELVKLHIRNDCFCNTIYCGYFNSFSPLIVPINHRGLGVWSNFKKVNRFIIKIRGGPNNSILTILFDIYRFYMFHY